MQAKYFGFFQFRENSTKTCVAQCKSSARTEKSIPRDSNTSKAVHHSLTVNQSRH